MRLTTGRHGCCKLRRVWFGGNMVLGPGFVGRDEKALTMSPLLLGCRGCGWNRGEKALNHEPSQGECSCRSCARESVARTRLLSGPLRHVSGRDHNQAVACCTVSGNQGGGSALWGCRLETRVMYVPRVPFRLTKYQKQNPGGMIY